MKTQSDCQALEAEIEREEQNAKRGTRCTPVAGATPSPQAMLKKHKVAVEPEDSECVLLQSDEVLFTALKDQLGSPSPGPNQVMPSILEDGYDMVVSPAKPNVLFLSPYKPPSDTQTPSKTPSKTPYDPVADADTQPGKTPQRHIDFMDTLVMSPCPPTVIDPYGDHEATLPNLDGLLRAKQTSAESQYHPIQARYPRLRRRRLQWFLGWLQMLAFRRLRELQRCNPRGAQKSFRSRSSLRQWICGSIRRRVLW